jgi:S-ribosylhomocysteine lyase LuxS involved in autoinducer biosynthesis
MLTIEDCIALSELTEQEILAIQDHEHIPEIVAAELGNYLVHTPSGERAIKRMIADDIDHARAHGDHQRTATLKMVLRHFVEQHAAAR